MNTSIKTYAKGIFFVALLIILGSLIPKAKAETLGERLSGRILLQVEQNGEAWFVDPVSKQRYFMGRPLDAFNLMRFLGLGITDTNLARIPINGTVWDGPASLMNHVRGRIVLQVEQNGEAWHISPVNSRRYYMGRPADAFQLMRNLGLGITDANLESIPIHSDSADPPNFNSGPEDDDNSDDDTDDGHGNDDTDPSDGGDDDDSNDGDDSDDGNGESSVPQDDETLYPTIAGVDYDAFPEDPGDSYSPSGTTYYIATNGSDSNSGTSLSSPFRSFAKATDTVSSGDMVIVRSGTYQHCLNGEEGCWRLAFGTSNVIWTNYGSEDVTITTTPGATSWGIWVGGNNVTIDGIDLDGFGDTSIALAGSNTILKNLTIDTAANGTANGMKADSTHDGLLVKSVTILDAALAIGSDSSAVTNWRIDDVLIDNNSLGSGSGGDAIGVENGDNFLFTNLTTREAAADGIDVKGSRVAVFNAHSYDNSRNGVKFWQGGDLVNSLVHDNAADAAVIFDNTGTYRILNTVIAWHNRDSGDSSYSLVVGYDHQSNPINLTLQNSALCGNTGPAYYSGATSITRNTNIEQSETSCASLGFNSSLKYSSGAQMANGGINVSNMPPYDFDGDDRTQGSAPDIGAYELF